MAKKILWYSILIIFVISLTSICVGFVMAVKVSTGPVEEVSKPITQQSPGTGGTASNDQKNVKILILGDSIAKGSGDETARGIGGYLPDNLKNYTAKDIVVNNLGIDGLKSGELVEQLKNGSLDNEMLSSDVILISIGGNDLREIQRLSGIDRQNAFRQKQDAYISILKEVTKKVRSTNKDAFLIFVGLYNPYGDENNGDEAQFIHRWNYSTQLVFADDARAAFISTYDLFKLNASRFISADKLHPNSAGYQMIANLISRSLEDIMTKI
ncbi:MAG TPA: GDSL-type esterase/lipase family protein [Pseudobacteroides sp.]|uniref:GDSL-type esterase/lipase family protein n=1 Tax=Pseudobacteroides sp. TaxID=1968840 RepID=UPI002F947966